MQPFICCSDTAKLHWNASRLPSRCAEQASETSCALESSVSCHGLTSQAFEFWGLVMPPHHNLTSLSTMYHNQAARHNLYIRQAQRARTCLAGQLPLGPARHTGALSSGLPRAHAIADCTACTWASICNGCAAGLSHLTRAGWCAATATIATAAWACAVASDRRSALGKAVVGIRLQTRRPWTRELYFFTSGIAGAQYIYSKTCECATGNRVKAARHNGLPRMPSYLVVSAAHWRVDQIADAVAAAATTIATTTTTAASSSSAFWPRLRVIRRQPSVAEWA